jgi:hypothetical protein
MNVCLIVFSNYLKHTQEFHAFHDPSYQALFTPSQEELKGYGGSHELHMR